MSEQAESSVLAATVYPETDGKPMADNTFQFEWITTIKGGLEAKFADREDVFVAGDLLWYPVEGNNKIRIAPDTLVAFGRPQGHRRSYQQWREGGIAPQVVFEVLSPNNHHPEMVRKLQFYDRYGVQEYYIVDPDRCELNGWIRGDDGLVEIDEIQGWTSPLLGVRFETSDGELKISANGQNLATYLELYQQLQVDRQRAEQERQRAERLAAQLRSLGVEPQA